MSGRLLRVPASRCRAGLARSALYCLTAAALLAAAGVAPAAEADSYEQKAEFTVNFAKFSYWPPGRFPPKGGKFTLCQLQGNNRLARALGALEGRTVQGYPIEFRRIENPAQASGCVLLYAAGRAPQLRASDAVLTVGNGASFAQQGGMIGLLQDGQRLRFEVNLAALQRSGIVMSSQVLSLASNLIDASVLSATEPQPGFLPAATQAPRLSPIPPVESAVQPLARGR